MLISDGINAYSEFAYSSVLLASRHITFSAKEALRMKKNVYYVTNVGVFRLTANGLELCEVTPGINSTGPVI